MTYRTASVLLAVTALGLSGAGLTGCIVVVDRDNESDFSSWEHDKRIGIEVGSVRPAVGAQASVMPGTGLVVTRVVPGSPAAAAGLQQYDVIKGVEGQADGTLKSLRAAIYEKAPGETLTLTVVRAGQEMTVTPHVIAVDED